MSYSECTIRQVIADIDANKTYLPALQRKFVWDKWQIELLFDSLMRNYPFGTFLFWKLNRKKADNYVFYEFLTKYDARNPWNHRKTGPFLQPEIIGVLDGQQRLSSLYIGLMGTHTEKEPYMRWWNPDAYISKALHLNLLSLPYRTDENDRVVPLDDQNFEFCFVSEGQAECYERRVHRDGNSEPAVEPVFWMKVGNVLSWDEEQPEFDQIFDSFVLRCKTDAQKATLTSSRRFVKRALETLYLRITKEKLINYFTITKDDLEDILKIFVRVNSGGTVLNKTDLLFSTIVATWDEGRDKIENLLKVINQKGDGFCFSNEFLMRCCLVLSDGPVTYNVKSFKAENVQKIRDAWTTIETAVGRMVDLLVEFGLDGEVLTSQNATIILAYYISKGGTLDPESREGMRKYLLHALLNTIFGSAQEQLLSSLRNGFRKEECDAAGTKRYTLRLPRFSFSEVLKIELPQQKRLSVTEEDLERHVDSQKGPAAFFLLSQLYPGLRYSEVSFHQDHIHPYSGFTNENLSASGIPESEHEKWYDYRDRLGNLQLLSESRNTSKNATPLKDWVARMPLTVQKTFATDNYFPDGVGLEFKDFIEFYTRRRELLRNELRKVLSMTAVQPSPSLEQWTSPILAPESE